MSSLRDLICFCSDVSLVQPDVMNVIVNCFSSHNEEIKSAASYALGQCSHLGECVRMYNGGEYEYMYKHVVADSNTLYGCTFCKNALPYVRRYCTSIPFLPLSVSLHLIGLLQETLVWGISPNFSPLSWNRYRLPNASIYFCIHSKRSVP